MADKWQIEAAIAAYRSEYRKQLHSVAPTHEQALAVALIAADRAAWRRPWLELPEHGQVVEVATVDERMVLKFHDSGGGWHVWTRGHERTPSNFRIDETPGVEWAVKWWRPLPPGPETREDDNV